jgi:hypothetical protein
MLILELAWCPPFSCVLSSRSGVLPLSVPSRVSLLSSVSLPPSQVDLVSSLPLCLLELVWYTPSPCVFWGRSGVSHSLRVLESALGPPPCIPLHRSSDFPLPAPSRLRLVFSHSLQSAPESAWCPPTPCALSSRPGVLPLPALSRVGRCPSTCAFPS